MDTASKIERTRRLAAAELRTGPERISAAQTVGTGGGGGDAAVEATVIVGVEYADAEGVPPEGISQYVCRLASDTTADWAIGTEYQIDAVVICPTDNRKYQSLTVNTGNDPSVSPAHWELLAEISPRPLSPRPSAQPSDMRWYLPHYQTNADVFLLQIEGVWHFAQRMIKVETGTGGSLMWNHDENRMMAVFR